VPDKTRRQSGLLVLLSRWRVNVGFVAALLVIFLAGHPTPESVRRWLPLAIVGLALRVWARGHLELRTPLVVSGPYAFARHPLYIGSFCMGLAFTAMIDAPWVVAAFAIGFLLMYVPKGIREERYLRGLHGAAWDAYATRVGPLFPKRHTFDRGVAPSTRRFAWRRVLRHREYETWAGAAAVCAVLWLRAYWRI
jgi:protein-S-isoprenylcysteine O-methyltransferase Ste14